MIYMSPFWKFPTFTMCGNKLVHQKLTEEPKTNKKAAKLY